MYNAPQVVAFPDPSCPWDRIGSDTNCNVLPESQPLQDGTVSLDGGNDGENTQLIARFGGARAVMRLIPELEGVDDE